MNRSTAWFLACRPKTLTVSLSPVLVGTAIGWHEADRLLWLPLLAAALGAALIQIGTNLFNDVGDFLRGIDRPGRFGPRRATAEGWLAPDAVRIGAWISFALAFLCGVYLVAHAGWPIVAIGLCSLYAGWSYTGGPRPIAYGPFGEFFVLVFFGIVAVGGSHYLQMPAWSPLALLAGTLLGLHAAAVITVNNYRDLDTDRDAGRRTLAVRLGRPATRWLYGAEMLLPYPLLAWLSEALGAHAALPLLTLPLALLLCLRFVRTPPGPAFNGILAATAAHQLGFAALLALAFLRP